MAKLQSLFTSKQNLCPLDKEGFISVLQALCFFLWFAFCDSLAEKKKDLGRNHHLPGNTYSMSKSVRLMYYKERESEGD